jgi:hypothetical protein
MPGRPTDCGVSDLTLFQNINNEAAWARLGLLCHKEAMYKRHFQARSTHNESTIQRPMVNFKP